AGDAARDVGEALANKIAVSGGDALQFRVEAATPATCCTNGFQFRARSGADFHARTIVGEDLELLDVVIGLSGHDRVHAARVVANHAAQSAAIMRGGVRRESEMVL